jgi:hypothetical protein
MRLALLLSAVLAFPGAALAADPVFEGPVARATCGPGSDPESPGALQGEVTGADRDSGRSLRPFTCNLALVGNDPGPGTSWQHTWYDHCAYYDTKMASNLGVQVIDVSDPAKPRTATTLTTTAMQDPWESLSVNQSRGLLAGVYTANLYGPLFFDVYDVKKDCAKPELISSLPVNTVGHEGDWAPDGMTYYGSGGPGVTAIDVTDPAAPHPVGEIPISTHGLSISDDGNRAYLATLATGSTGNGLTIVDTSGIQSRNPAAAPRIIGSVSWTDGFAAQHTIPITVKGRPYILFVDEGGLTTVPGAARFIDISDEAHPRVVSKLKLEIHMPDQQERRDETGTENTFGYDAHYCGVDRRVDPTIVVCSMFQSGERVFDVRDVMHPKEIAYYNPGGTGEPPKPGSQDNSPAIMSGYPSARPRIITERGEIWFTDQNKGFHVVRFTNGVWPFKATGPAHADLGLEASVRCLTARAVKLRVKQPRARRLKSAEVFVNGKRVKTLRGAALRRLVTVKLPKGHAVVRIVGRARSGKRYSQTRGYTRC